MSGVVIATSVVDVLVWSCENNESGAAMTDVVFTLVAPEGILKKKLGDQKHIYHLMLCGCNCVPVC